MDFLNDRRVLLAMIGAALALLAGLAIAVVMGAKNRGDKAEPPPAAQAGLVIDAAGAADDGKLDAAKPLRCFVGGLFVGELTLAECAKRNGVATGALDVGIDSTGALAATDQAGTVLAPLPPTNERPATTPSAPSVAVPATPAATPGAPAASGAPAGACMRYADQAWRELPGDLTLAACVQALYGGRCERPGGATYGRWMQQTLRLVPGKVEISGDNRSFRRLTGQSDGCVLEPIG